ncbi:MAG: hypothetical protein QUV35_07455, partial [Hydrogenophaga sp.]|uniref:hypothetical protein n=1 Tax=Hydrogenophaga sp. TaxID=1904254 RepID=UPI00260EA98B
MTSTPKANVKAIIKAANGSQQSYSLEALSKLTLLPGTKLTLVEEATGKPVKGLLAKRKGKDLVLELEGQGEVASLLDFYSVSDVAFFPAGEIPVNATASNAGAVTADTATASVTAAGEPIVWKAPSDFGNAGWLVAGGAGLAAGAGGGGAAAATAVVVVKPAVLLGNFVMGPVVEGSGLVATVYNAAGEVLGVAVIQDDGSFELALQEPYTGPVLVVVTDENGAEPDYWDEATGAPKDLTADLRAMTYVNNGQVVNVNVNVFTEAAVRELAAPGASLPLDVTAEQIAVANDKVKNALGLVEDLVTGEAPVAVVTNTGAPDQTANAYGKLLAAASGVDESGSTEATIESLRTAISEANPVLSTSVLLLAGAANVVDKVPSFLTESQMSLSDYFFIADAINALRTELTGVLTVGDLRTIKALNDQLAVLSGQLESLDLLGAATGVDVSALQLAVGEANTAVAPDPSNAKGLYLKIEQAVAAAVLELEGDIKGLQDQIDTLAIADVAGLTTALSDLDVAVKALQALTAEGGAVDLRLDAIEAQLVDITTTVVDYVDAEILKLQG